MIKNYVVEGMNSDAARASVEEEINALPGAQGVDIDADTGRVSVTGEEISDELVAAAVEAAGFRLRPQD